MAEFPESALTPYGTVGIAAGTWEKHNRLLNRTLFYNVQSQEFSGGADPTGTADSAAAINACWAAAPAGSTIWYPTGPSGLATYRTLTELQHPAKVLHHVMAVGAKIRNEGTGHVVRIDTTDGWTMTGMTVDGNWPTRTTGRGLLVVGCNDWAFEKGVVQNTFDLPFVIRGGKRWKVKDTLIKNTRLSGLRLGEAGGTDIEDFVVENLRTEETTILEDTIPGNQGHAALQTHGMAGAAPSFLIRRGRIINPTVINCRRVGLGLDYLTDSELIGGRVIGSHTGEAVALTGNNNRVIGGQWDGSTGAAGLLLWSWAGNGQDNRDTEIDGARMFGTTSADQGLAIVPAENNVAFRDIDIHGIRAKGWAYGVQNYNTPGPKTGITIAASVVVHDSNLRDNATGQTLFATAGATLRDNVA